MIGQQALQNSDLVHQGELGRGVVRVTASRLPDELPVLLFHLGAVVLVTRS